MNIQISQFFLKHGEKMAKGKYKDTSDPTREIWKESILGKGEEGKYGIKREVGKITIGV